MSADASADILREVLLPKLDGVRPSGGNWSARCPAHDDVKPSLSISRGDDQPVVLYCQAGCATVDILAAINLTPADLCKPRNEERVRPTVVETYEYVDRNGELLFVKERRFPKDFSQRRPNGHGGWEWKLGDTPRVLYRLPQVLAAIKAGTPIYVVEGERDVHSAEKAGAVATCNFDGAAVKGARTKWRPEYGDTLRGAHVIIVADNDDAGRAHADAAAEDLKGKAASVKVVRGLVTDEHADLTDHLAVGHKLDDLVPLHEEPPSLVAVPAATMTMKAPTWLSAWRIPAGAITLLGGREGIGKSTIAYDHAAQITRGDLEGCHKGTPKGVGVVATEDDWESVILPRLVAARADLNRIYRLEAVTEEGQYETISVPAQLDELQGLCHRHEIVMIIVDPIMSVISGSLDTHKDREVRRALDPLNRFANESGVAIFALIHVNKSSSTDPLNSLMASRAFSAVARSVLYCILDPEAEEEDRYLFGHPKSNLGPKQPTVQYRITMHKIVAGENDPHAPTIVTSRIIWGDADERSIRDAMETERPSRKAGETATGLVEWINDQGRTVSTAEIAEAFPKIKRATLNQNLSRLVQREEITRPMHGHYAPAAAPETPGRGGSDSGSDSASGARHSVTSVIPVISITEGDDLSRSVIDNDSSDSYDTKDVSRDLSFSPVTPLTPPSGQSGTCRGCGWSLDSEIHEVKCVGRAG